MKKVLLGLALVLGLAKLAHASSSATLFLEGYVETICEIYIDPVIGALTTLDVVGGETSRNIATATENFNGVTGYTVSIESTNAGNLTHNNGTNNVAYTIEYDGGTATAPGAIGTPAIVKTVAGPLTAAITDTSTVDITVTAGGATLPAGAYTDTLIFTIQAL